MLYAISVDSPKRAGELKARLKLSFPVLSDTDGTVARKWGVLNYKTEISKPATFLIERGGKILFKKVGEDMTDRPDPDELLELAGRAQSNK